MQGVLLVRPGLADIAHTEPGAQAVEGAGVEVVVTPDGGHVLGRLVRGIALVAVQRLGVGDVGVGVAGQDLEVLADLGVGFQLDALGAHFAHRGEEVVLGQLGGDVLLGDVEHRGGVHAVAVLRLELQAGFPLLALGRLQGLAGGIRVGVRVERLGIADVGRDAVVEQVEHADAAGELAPLLVALAARAAVLVRDFHPVLAHAEGEAPLVEVDQVLHVQAGLLQATGVIVLGEEGQGFVAVHRVEGVERRGDARGPVHVGLAALVVEAGEQGVAGGSGVEFGLHHVVDDVGLQLLAGTAEVAIQLIAVRRGPAVPVDLGQVDVGGEVAEVLPRGPDLVEAVFQLVAEHALGAVEVVEARLAIEELTIDASAIVLEQAAVGRHTAVVAAVGLVLEVALEGQGGVFTEIDGQGRGDGVALVLGVVELGVATLAEAHQAVGDALLVIQRAAEVEAQFLLAHVADGRGDLAEVLVQRLLAGQRDQPARQAAAVEHRGRALEHVDAFEEERVDLHRAEGAAVAHGLQAVEVDVVHAVVGEAAHHHVVVAVRGAHLAGEDAGGVAHGLLHGLRALVVDLLAGDHRYRLRGFHQRLAGLGGDLAVGGQVAVLAAQRVAQGEHLGRRHFQRAAGRHFAQHEAAAAEALRLQRGAAEELGQAGFHRVAAGEALGAQAAGLRRGGGKVDAGLAGEAVQRLNQGPGGDGVAAAGDGHRLFGNGAGGQQRGGQGRGEQGAANGEGEVGSAWCGHGCIRGAAKVNGIHSLAGPLRKNRQKILRTLKRGVGKNLVGANSFAKQAEGLPLEAHRGGQLCCPWRMNSPPQDA
ncbi:hypothetical protein D3C78_447820 [compost metagenome]